MSDGSGEFLKVQATPLHGYQGDRQPEPPSDLPLAASIAISREVGARGTDIARRIAAKNGWMVYDNELLGFSSQDSSACESVLNELPSQAGAWIDERMRLLHQRGLLGDEAHYERVARLILALGVRGEAIFVGRGAGFILPRRTTLHVRLTAPLPERVAYMSQFLRLSHEEAASQVASREQKRTAFLARCLHLPADGVTYDMVLNSTGLGEDLCADLILHALRCKGRGDALGS